MGFTFNGESAGGGQKFHGSGDLAMTYEKQEEVIDAKEKTG